jgi:hypothetical protein
MAIGLIMDFEGGTLDQYDQVVEKMALGGKVPDGAHFHWVTKTDDGIRVVDVWEDPAKFAAFSEEKIGPITAEVGLSPPSVTQYEVHNILD